MSDREYTGSVYLAVIEGDTQYGICRDSVETLIMRRGDVSSPAFYRGTKGYHGRQHAFDDFVQSGHEFLALLDGDMVFEQDCIERLRSHKLPYVSGFYTRRDYAPIMPVWYKPFSGEWPHEVFTDPIESGKLYELGASGWGLMLIHRDVITETRKVLRGEWDVLEDDMDVWPYDLREIIGAVDGLDELANIPPENLHLVSGLLRKYVGRLRSNIRPLRADKAIIIGSDIRYPWYARQAGFTLYGDPDAKAAHMVNYPLSLSDYQGQPDNVRLGAQAAIQASANQERAELRADMAALYG